MPPSNRNSTSRGPPGVAGSVRLRVVPRAFGVFEVFGAGGAVGVGGRGGIGGDGGSGGDRSGQRGVGLGRRALVADVDGQPRDQVGGLPGPLGDGGKAEPGVPHEDLLVRPEPGAGAGDLLGHPAELAQPGPAGEARARGGLAAVGEFAGDTTPEAGRPGVAAAVHFHVQPRGQRVDHGRAHPVQATGSGVGAAAELPARVQPGHDQLYAGELALRLDVDRDAAAVVADLGRPVGVQHDFDPAAVAAQRLVHRVVEDLPQAVLQAAAVGRADVHAGTLAHRVQAFQDGQVPGGVRIRLASLPGGCRGRVRGGGKRGHGGRISLEQSCGSRSQRSPPQ